jgi:hypothetical protein
MLRALGVIMIANALFFAASYGAPGDPAVVADRVRTAFASGMLTTEDFLPFDSVRGYYQYIDCFVLQMMVNPQPSRVHRALAPLVYTSDGAGECATLRSLVIDGADRAALHPDAYSRYWHGQNVPVALALRVMELATLRRVFVTLVWGAIAVVGVVSACRGRSVRLVGGSIALTAALWWATPYFAPGFAYGPCDLVILVGLAVVVARPRLVDDARGLLAFAAGFGACVLFFELMTGELLVAWVWFGALVLAAAHDGRARSVGPSPVGTALLAMMGFLAGVTVSVVIKQMLVAALIDVSGVANFLSHLAFYTKTADATRAPGFLVPFVRMGQNLPVLTYGSMPMAVALAAVVTVAWMVAVARAWSAGGRETLVLAGMALAPFAWIILWSTHTTIHASFMVRMFAATIALAAPALLWRRDGS